MQHERRRDPYPWTWEPPTAAAVGVVLTLAGGIQLARSLANLIVGAGWTWPAPDAGIVASPIGAAFWTSLPGILAGRSDAGLPTSAPDHLAGAGLLWTVLALMLAALLTVIGRVGVLMYRWGPGRVRGMATAAEAETLLGRSRLRKVAAIIRPDLTHTVTAGRVSRTARSAADAPGSGDSAPAASPWRLPPRDTRANP